MKKKRKKKKKRAMTGTSFEAMDFRSQRRNSTADFQRESSERTLCRRPVDLDGRHWVQYSDCTDYSDYPDYSNSGYFHPDYSTNS